MYHEITSDTHIFAECTYELFMTTSYFFFHCKLSEQLVLRVSNFNDNKKKLYNSLSYSSKRLMNMEINKPLKIKRLELLVLL